MHVYIMYMYTNVYMIYSCRLAGWLAGELHVNYMHM